MSGLFSQPSAPDYSPISTSNVEVARIQQETGREQLAYQKKKDREASLLAKQVSDIAMTNAINEEKRSSYYFDQYKNYGSKVDQKIAEDAMNFNTQAEQDRMAGQAQADIERGFTQSRGIAARQALASGASPERFAALNQRMQRDEALAIAGGKTASRLQARDMGLARLYNASQLYKGMPANASTAAGVSNAGGSSAINAVNSTNQVANQGMATTQGWFSGATNSYNSAANIMNMGFSNRATAADMGNKGTAALLNFGGAMAGTFLADGGMPDPEAETSIARGLINGPGTDISDSIPARLSKGEYVIPADVVRAKGVQFFDKLVDQHHTPAAVQEARRGLRRKK